MPSETTSRVLAPSTLKDFTSSSLIVVPLRQRDTAGIIGELSQALQHERCVPDVLPFYHAALNQELLADSAVGSGIAFPHARISTIRELRFALGRLPEPVVWGAQKSGPVDLVFLLAVPATDAACYLHLRAGLTRLGRQPNLLASLRAAESVEAVLSVLGKIKLRPD